jgi:hypothetical protein
MDDIFNSEKFNYKGFNSLFCCLGSQTKYGEEIFVKVDKKYPLSAADIALRNRKNIIIQTSLIICWFLRWEPTKNHGFYIQKRKDKYKEILN